LIYYAAQKLKELPDTVLVNDQDNEVVYTAVEEEPLISGRKMVFLWLKEAGYKGW